MKSENTVDGVLRCRDLLSIPSLQGAVLLAGDKGLGNPISRVNVMEVPDIINWVRSGEFLITTGYSFKDNPVAFLELIPQLVSRGVAALGIKTKRFFDIVPPNVIECANQHNFPLIELPQSTAFSDVVRDVMEQVLTREFKSLSELQNRIQTLTNSLLEGQGIKDFLRNLEKALGNPVVLLDSSNQLLVSRETEQELNDYIHEIPWFQYRKDALTGSASIILAEKRVKAHISVIPLRNENLSLLILLEWNEVCKPVDILTIDRVGALVGLEIMNENARRAVETKYIDQFIQDWLTGRILTRSDLSVRAEACGVHLYENTSYSVAIISWSGERPSGKQLKLIVNELRRMGKQAQSENYLSIIEDELAVILPDKENSKGSRINISTQFLMSLRSVFNNIKVSMCLGKSVNAPENINESYLEAKHIKKVSLVCEIDDEIITYDKLGVFSLLYLLPQCQELDEFKARFVKPLYDYDKTHGTCLIDTLNTYFKVRCNTKATASALFTHYNTVAYRLDRIRSILNRDIDDPEIQLQLQLALKLNLIYPQQNGQLAEDLR